MSVVQEKRLKVLQNEFYISPIKTIQSFIGIDANILEYTVNNIYIDGYLVVDVKFSNLDLDPSKIYWTKFKDCKILNIKKSNAYICNINGFNVCVIINNKPDNPEQWLPMNINITIPTQRNEVFYKYYGVIIDTPFHEANTQIFNFNHSPITEDLSKCNIDTVLFSSDVIQKSYDKINNIFTYKSTIQSITSQELVRINSLEDGKDKDKLYIIDIRKIKDVEKFKGFIACSQYRENPWDVLYINIPNYILTRKKIEYLKWFMLNDYKNYSEWLEKII